MQWNKDKYERHIAELEERIKELQTAHKTDLLSGLLTLAPKPKETRYKKYPKLSEETLEVWVIVDKNGREIISTQDGCTKLDKAWLELWKKEGTAWPTQEELLMFITNAQAQGMTAVSKKFYLIIN